MLKFYSLKKKIYQFLQIFITFLQIAFFLTIFLVSTYWFFELLNLHIIDFLKPLADLVRGFMKLFYKHMIVVNEVEVDGSILLFDIIAIISIISLSQVMVFLKRELNKLDIIFDKLVNDTENAFNKELQADSERLRLKNCNVGILISYSVKDLMGNAFWSEKQEVSTSNVLVDKYIYSVLSGMPGGKIAKTGSQFLLCYKNFDKIDFLISHLNAMFIQIDEFLQKKQLSLTTYVAVHTYDNETDIKEVFTILNRLLAFKIPDKILCIGEFNLRYELMGKKNYKIQILGDYFVPPDIKVFCIVKKR